MLSVQEGTRPMANTMSHFRKSYKTLLGAIETPLVAPPAKRDSIHHMHRELCQVVEDNAATNTWGKQP
jgi:hypothetical protein